MKDFLAWLSNPGPAEEIFTFLILAIVLSFIFALLSKFNISFKDVKIDKRDDESKKEEHIPEPSKEDVPHKDSLSGGTASIIASQDYRIINLIITNHYNQIKEEMKQYCIVNGLNKKSVDEYKVYVDDKKALYITELKDLFSKEYTSFDVMDVSDIYQIIDEETDYISNKLDRLYNKIREISIEEHQLLDEENKELSEAYDKYYESVKSGKLSDIENTEMKEKLIRKSKKISYHEHVDILNKQITVIDLAKQELISILMTKVFNAMKVKISQLRG